MDTDFVLFRRRFLLLFICIQGLLWRREVRENLSSKLLSQEKL